ncbi:MAG TPA: sulfate ABC transporter ATP-binding protein, partial [Rhodospirillaceae bacterium]|nr:sulfate ABC transporter ATP-binding protein [Rhodospirillaceae bacterium]
QVGTPSEIYDQPATPFVYQFLGNVNAINCRITGGVARAGELTLPAPKLAYLGDSKAVAFLRPHDIAIEPSLAGQGTPAVIRYLSVLGALVRIEAEVGDQLLDIEITRQRLAELQLKIGQVVLLAPRNPRFFLEDDGEAVIPDASI